MEALPPSWRTYGAHGTTPRGPGLTPEAEELGRIIETAVLVVCQYAPDAPAVVLKEAAARTAAYLWNMNRGPLVRERVGDQEAEVNVTRHAAFRHSGAMSLVSPWKVRRAGSIA